ncbi:MAG: PKD domain-containing protein, partial [Limisphaerales bacterium]
LRGFTLRDGATRNAGDAFALQSGGGAWCGSTNESLLNCVLTNNTAAYYGGGTYQGQLGYCILEGNSANNGGGVYKGFLKSSALFSNTASSFGGGAYGSYLVSCTVTLNSAPSGLGGGLYSSWGWNSIIFGNLGSFLGQDNDWDLGSWGHFVSCWTTTSPSDMTTPSPQLVPDNIHIAATSPCRGAGNPAYLSGTDLDGEAWLNSPSIGCAEYYAADFTGPLALGPVTVRGVWSYPSVLRNGLAVAYSSFTGNADRLAWSFGDGVVVTNAYAWAEHHTWTNAGDFDVTFTAYNADNPNGVSTNALIHVALPDPPLLSASSLTGTTFTVTLPMQGGVRYYIDQTTNLTPPVAWQSIGYVVNNLYPLSTGVVADVNATNPMRFYRIRAQ